MVKLEVMNPVASIKSAAEATFATRSGDLSGKTIGLFWDNKPAGDTINEFTAEFLAQKFKNIRFKNYYGSMGLEIRHATEEDLGKMAKECDAVVGSLGD